MKRNNREKGRPKAMIVADRSNRAPRKPKKKPAKSLREIALENRIKVGMMQLETCETLMRASLSMLERLEAETAVRLPFSGFNALKKSLREALEE
jgi:hypothetical protein